MSVGDVSKVVNTTNAEYEKELAAAIKASEQASKSSCAIKPIENTTADDTDLKAEVEAIEAVYKKEKDKSENDKKDKREKEIPSAASSASSSSSASVTDSELKKQIEAIDKACKETKDLAAKVEALKPTENEEWTKKELDFLGKAALVIFRGGALKLILSAQGKSLSEASWKAINDIKTSDVKTVGDVEKIAIQIIKKSNDTQEEKLKSAAELKRYLKMYSEKGLFHVTGEAMKKKS